MEITERRSQPKQAETTCDSCLGSLHPLGGDTEGDGCLVDAGIATVAMVYESSSRHTVADADLDPFVMNSSS